MEPAPSASGDAFGALLFLFFILAVVILPWLPIIIGGVVGTFQERRHLEEMSYREQRFVGMAISDLKTPPPGMRVAEAGLVEGSVVIAADHFKSLCARFRKFFGGEFASLQRMQERARREALLRMMEKAHAMGATAICNVRVQACTIAGKRHGKVAGSEIIAYGTALVPARGE